MTIYSFNLILIRETSHLGVFNQLIEWKNASSKNHSLLKKSARNQQRRKT